MSVKVPCLRDAVRQGILMGQQMEKQVLPVIPFSFDLIETGK